MNRTGSRGAHMATEIVEQPERWRDLLRAGRGALESAAQLIRDADPALIVFAARGSSDHAALYAQYLTHNLLGIPALLATPSTVTAFGSELHYPATVMLAVSQSGESPDILETVRAAKRAGVPVVAFTNSDTNSLAALADVHVPLSAGPELSVAATKTYTAELLALHLVIRLAAGDEWAVLEQRVMTAADVATALIAASTPRLAGTLEDVDRVLVVGRGYSMSTAKEGALKLMETNAIAASGWSAADATHGPLGQVVPGTPVIVLTGSPDGRESVEAFAQAARDLGGRVIAVGDPVGGPAEHVPLLGLQGADLDPALLPLIEVIPLQQLALDLARRRGMDPDQPIGLAKVTKTR
jgi:glucosamine--fructose-6-phosphate aminotransferase (isomerizing)